MAFVFVSSWNEYVVVFVLAQKTELQSLTVAMPQFLGLCMHEQQLMLTTSVIVTIPVIIIFALVEKCLIGGPTVGSIK